MLMKPGVREGPLGEAAAGTTWLLSGPAERVGEASSLWSLSKALTCWVPCFLCTCVWGSGHRMCFGASW